MKSTKRRFYTLFFRYKLLSYKFLKILKKHQFSVKFKFCFIYPQKHALYKSIKLIADTPLYRKNRVDFF